MSKFQPVIRQPLVVGVIAFLAVVVVAAVVVPIVIVTGSHAPAARSPVAASSAPSSSAAGAAGAWKVGSREVPQYDHGIDSWVVGDTLVAVNDTSAVAYSRADGRQVWQVGPPSGHFCGASTAVVDNRVAVGFGDLCSSAALLDLGTGKLLWHKPMPITSSASPSEHILDEQAVLEIVGGTVVVAHEGNLIGLDAATGAVRWSEDTPPADGKVYTNCRAMDGLPRNGAFALLSTCESVQSYEDRFVAVLVDPASGKPRQQNEFVKSDSYLAPSWLSASPPIVCLNDTENGSYVFLDDAFKPVATVPTGPILTTGLTLSDGFGYNHISHGTSHERSRALVSGTTLVTVTNPQRPNSLVALDVRTGAKLWQTPAPGGGSVMAPLAVEDGEIVTEVAPPDGGPRQQVVKFSLAHGTAVPAGAFSITTSDRNGPDAWTYRFFWADGHVYGIRGDYNSYNDAMVFRLG
ncbi:PQQ-binding-like beta-propeller repeat protein [Amycolatopsis rhabdoformis]|uniref:PQQ-binding-like beta-propeller repeat protein n=1 Tax=Amycolatopsis rhabdoformis TaxID=1448059 RepID=A0ABZ1I0W1_9PSEU|nr:PQQ-binding-like beta-propeller repeat protein [Amycolatopsis rhabdoformis]WSE28047.1 PQQ-binding-like beta-propeller repeat protein [Amycolatopsis rhabdoformis]